VTNYLSIIVAAALANNLILIQLFGVSSLFYSTKKLPQAIEFALFNFVVLFLSLIINLIIYRFFLIPFHLEFFRLFVFVATSALSPSDHETLFLLNKAAGAASISNRRQ
jgi:Na+-translocating ferredoxin:NAD+ oxidoreductase RnfA subunit